MTTQGALTRYALAGMRFPNAISAGPKDTMWFTDYAANAVGRIIPTSRPAKTTSRRPLPRVTLISDSVAASIAFDAQAKSLLENGVDLFLEPGQARTLGPTPPGVLAPPSVLQLVTQLGPRLGKTVVVQIGDNDDADNYATKIEAALNVFQAAGVKHVLWLTLHESVSCASVRGCGPNHTNYPTMNKALVAVAAKRREMTVLDWNTFSARHPEWFTGDGVHLESNGPRALAQFIHTSLVKLRIPRES
jgi:hypothetical protein